MINPKVSIIVPVYNVEKYLENCIKSILDQTLKEFELVLVVDGASTDNSGNICHYYKKQDKRIKVVHIKDIGVSACRNKGVDISTGDFIGFVDGDDYIDKDMYKKLYQLCIDNESDISVCKLGREIDGKLINAGEEEFIKIFNNSEGMSELFKGIYYRFSLCNKLFRKSCFNEISFPEGRIHEDLSTAYKLFANADKVVYINYVGYIYVKRNNSILTKKYEEKRLDAFIGWNEIICFMSNKYPNLMDTVISCFAYMVIDHIYYIFNQVDNRKRKKELLKELRKKIKPHYKKIINNKELDISSKFLVRMLNINVSMLIAILNLKARIKGVCYE